MATIRHHTRIARSADAVWAAVADAGTIARWFPDFETSEVEGSERRCRLADGGELVEEIVTNDDDLRRFQYRITGGAMTPRFHLGTVDVLEDGDGALVIYSAEVEPDELAGVMDASIRRGVAGLREHLEGGG